MDNFNTLRRTNYSATYLGNSDKLKPNLLSSPVRIAGENVIASSSDYKKMSENLDAEFSTMRARNHFDSQSMINQDEIERLRQNKSQTFLIKPDTDRVLERLFNEVYYKKENEGRAKAEIDKIKQTIWNIDQNLKTARELRIKAELGDLLLERECLAELERDLIQDITWFKDMYDKRKKEEFLHPHRRVISEIEAESQKIRDLRQRKEQIDYDRLRLSRNLEKIEKGDFKNIQRDVTDLLKETQAQKLKQQAFNLNPSDVKSLKSMITQGTDKVRVLRRDREELLKYGVMNKLELPKLHQEELNKKIEKYLREVERDCKNLQQRNDRLEKFRDKVSKYIDAEGVIDPANHQKVSEALEDLHRRHRAAIYHMQAHHGGSMDQSNSPDRSITQGLVTGRHSMSVSHHHTTNHFQNSEDSVSPGYAELDYNKQTPEAKQLSEMRVQERELRKVLGVLPTESPAYRQKLLEIIQLTQVMGELEKVVEEQRLQKEWSSTSRRDEQQMKKEISAKLRHAVYGGYAADQNSAFGSNIPSTDAQLRQNVAKRLRANVFGPEKPRFYERSAGFNIAFDWVGGLPQKYIGCQIVYAVYTKGEMMASPKLINVHKCQYSQGILNKSTFNVTYTVFDVPPSMDALAIFEFQCLTDVDVGQSDKPIVLGWSMIDLFDMMKAIKKGRWKIPIYTKPTDTHISFNRVKGLKRLKDLWFYLRLCIPSDESLTNDQTKNAETLMLNYDIPEMHARYWNETTPIPEEFLENKPTQPTQPSQRSPTKIPAETQPRELLELINKQSYNEVLHKPKDLYKEIIKDIFNEDMFGDLSRIEDKPFNLADELARDDAKQQANFNPLDIPRKEARLLDISVDYDYSKGLKLTILALRNFKMCSRFQITGGLMDGDEFILDEIAQDCVFGTKSKMLADLFTYKIDRTLEGGSDIQDSVEDENIPVDTMIAFNEVFYFLRNIPGLVLMKQNNLSINLVFQVIGIDEDGQPLRNKSTHDKYAMLRQPDEDEGEDFNNTPKQTSQSNFSFVCWYAIKLNRINGRIIEGRFIEPLYKPPMVKPPLENKEVQSTAARIEFIIEEYIYTANTLKEHKKKMQESSMNAIKKQFKPLPKKPVTAEKSDALNQQIESDDLKQQFREALMKPVVQLTFKPFIENRKIQYTNRLFEKGSGIDIYIDAARFLPDNVTVSKVYFNVYTQDALPIIKAQHSISDLESNCFSPNFKLKVELRAAYFSPTCIAVLSIETIDRSSNEEVRTVGYSAFNLFMGYHTNQPPILDSETNTILMEGCYQLPIFCQTPAITKPFTLNKMMSLDRIPCASLLVRVFQAPMTKDRMIVLSKVHVPETEWEQTGVLIPAPSYESGQYNTEFCMPTEAEMGLYLRRQKRQDMQVRARAIEMMTAEGYALERPDSEIIEWIEKKVIRTNATEALDMTYFAKYEPEMGFLVAVDGIHNPPDKLPYISVCCLNPPGALFQHPPDPNQVCINSELNWESPATSPQFTEGWFSFTDISPRRNLHLIFEIRSVSFARNNTPTIKTVGWALLPIFNAYNYVQSGIYQIPVFRGALSRDILDSITHHDDAWQYLMELMATKKAGLAYLEPTSLVIRLADGQREGHFKTPFDFTRINYKYLPQVKINQYVYNSAVEAKLKNTKRLSTIVPAKENPQEFNAKITAAINQELNQY